MELISRINSRVLERPLRITFSTALGAKDAIRSVLVRVSLQGGIEGNGEIPTSFAFPHESVPAILRTLRSVAPEVKGVPIDDYPEVIDRLRARHPLSPMTMSGLEVALFRCWLQARGVGELEYWGGRSSVCRTDITIPFTSDRERLRKWMNAAIRSNFVEFKVKTSGACDRDFPFLDFVYGVLQERCGRFRVRLDGNQGYDESSFLRLMDWCALRRYAVELVEQPLPRGDHRGLKRIRNRTDTPVLLDESIVTAFDLERALDAQACDGVNIKIAKSGIAESRRIMKLAQESGQKLMIGCMMETMTGLSAAIRMASGSGGFDFIDLDSVHFLFHRKNSAGIGLRGPEYHLPARS
ncbi:MAG: L-Ala-D/L-Glu epimerase [Syntrophaceae bacterium PtaU1.Bin231]|nr:MAG: L-Ala-D/L-Glu epimerase [Syntrophaceae bacterium PtaU1.Bin231]